MMFKVIVKKLISVSAESKSITGCRSFSWKLLAMLFTLSTFLASSKAVAQTETNAFYIQEALARYYVLPADAATISTGGSLGLSCVGSVCSYLNPARLGFMTRPEASTSIGTGLIGGNDFITHDRIERTEKRGYLTAGIPINGAQHGGSNLGVLAIGYSRYQGTTNDSVHTTPDGHRRTIGYGYAPTLTTAIGYSFTFYDDQLHSDVSDLHSHSRFLHLIGYSYAPDSDWELDGVLRIGLGQSDTEDYLTGADGLSYPHEQSGALSLVRFWEGSKAAISIDYSHLNSEGQLLNPSESVVFGRDEHGEVSNIRVGLEHRLFSSTLLRGGIRYQLVDYKFVEAHRDLSQRYNGAAFSTGLGYEFGALRDGAAMVHFDYGVEYRSVGHNGWEHIITLVLPF